MNNKHASLPVQGYKPQDDDAIGIVNRNKLTEEQALRTLDAMRQMPGIDQRWLAIGRTTMEQAWMAINRAVFQPGRAVLPGDEPTPKPE